MLWFSEKYSAWHRTVPYYFRRAHITEAVCAVPQSNHGAYHLGPSLVRSPDITVAQLCSHLSKGTMKASTTKVVRRIKGLTLGQMEQYHAHRKGHVNTSCYYYPGTVVHTCDAQYLED